MDLIIRRATTIDGRIVDIGVAGERIARVIPTLAERAPEEIEANGGLVTPALVEIHIHLDAVLTVGEPRYNQTGSLFEGIEIWSERVKTLSADDVKRRADRAIRWMLAHGVTHIRTHVDVCDPGLVALRALVELREVWKDVVTIQLVAFPQQGIYAFPDGEALLAQALALGADVVGGIPHYEWTREDGERDVKTALRLAREHGRPADLHCDETDDDQSRFLELVAAETIRLGLQGRVTASHTTAMHSYNNAYAYRLMRWMRAAGVHIVTNPLDNAVLQGRFDGYPVRRGYTRVKELLAHGINVALGHDSIMDPWYPLGVGDPIQACFVMVHYGHMSGYEEFRTLLEMVTTRAAACFGLSDYGLAEGRRADLVVFAAPTPMDVIRTLSPRLAVISGGRLVARTTPARAEVLIGGRAEAVSFLR
ncbi:MAG: cytosine deaminase [Armatimonadota bacterium]|nr:cytosine deaminase [Armatimonadota bacterium]MDR7485722.1 cytosine deaminase [Armatimonadota bacterium]MDR7534161.1 cytosine deaminase [Armatimonadota bacterium]MDR7536386.1 cytosine deaminase [Armatimonadota bacterium]